MIKELDWRDGIKFIETHLKWVEEQRKKMRDNSKLFVYYRKGLGFHK